MALEGGRAAPLEDPAARPEPRLPGHKVAGRVELGLIGELQGSGRREGQGSLVQDPRIEAEFPGRLRFDAEVGRPVRIGGIGIGCLGLVIAVDVELLDPGADLRDRGAIGIRVGRRDLPPEGVNQVPVDQAVCVVIFAVERPVTCLPTWRASRMTTDLPASIRRERRCQPDNASANNRDVALLSPRETGEAPAWRVCDPAGVRPSLTLSSFEVSWVGQR